MKRIEKETIITEAARLLGRIGGKKKKKLKPFERLRRSIRLAEARKYRWKNGKRE